jgi:hypothetical protein
MQGVFIAALFLFFLLRQPVAALLLTSRAPASFPALECCFVSRPFDDACFLCDGMYPMPCPDVML